jgi:hypothetical protein
MTFITYVAKHVRQTKLLGTGVESLSHHNPLWVADRA